MDPVGEAISRFIEHVGGGQLFRNLSPPRRQQAIEIMGRDFPTFFADFFENIDAIRYEYNKLKKNAKIPQKTWGYINEAVRSYICGQYIATCICSTIAVEASLKHIYSTRTSLPKKYTIERKNGNKTHKNPEKLWEYVEWAYQVNIPPKHTKLFTDGMRQIRNDLVHADDFDANESAKLMIVNMTSIILELYR